MGKDALRAVTGQMMILYGCINKLLDTERLRHDALKANTTGSGNVTLGMTAA